MNSNANVEGFSLVTHEQDVQIYEIHSSQFAIQFQIYKLLAAVSKYVYIIHFL